MKKKADGTFCAWLTARGYEQIDGEHYDKDAKVAPIVNIHTVFIMLTLCMMAGWHAIIMDIKGAFLHGEFEKNRQVYMRVPEGFEKFYVPDMILLLTKTL